MSRYVKDFEFPPEAGFTGSRKSAHPKRQRHKFADGGDVPSRTPSPPPPSDDANSQGVAQGSWEQSTTVDPKTGRTVAVGPKRSLGTQPIPRSEFWGSAGQAPKPYAKGGRANVPRKPNW